MALYATPFVPSGSEVVVITSVRLTMVMLSCFCADTGDEAESVTSTVKVKVPGLVGVPEITPLLALIDKPLGKLPDAVHLRVPVPPLACKVALYAIPVVPPGSEAVSMVGSGEMVTVVDLKAVLFLNRSRGYGHRQL